MGGLKPALRLGNHAATIAVEAPVRPLALLLVLALATAAFAAPKSKAKPKPKPRTVTLDVKDAEARDVLKAMQKQCGIKNVIIDPDVPRTTATLYFQDVPCDTAFRVVLRTYGLTTQVQVLR